MISRVDLAAEYPTDEESTDEDADPEAFVPSNLIKLSSNLLQTMSTRLKRDCL
jgi:hypothetical protein